MLGVKKKRDYKKFFIRWLLVILVIFFVMVFSLASAYAFYLKKYQGRIYPGVYAGQFELSGLTEDEAKQYLNQQMDKLNEDGIEFKLDGHSAILYPVISSIGGDLAFRTFHFDTEKNAQAAYAFGRTGGYCGKLKQQFKALNIGQYFDMEYELNEYEIDNFLHNSFSEYEKRAQNAKLTHTASNYYYLSGIEFDASEESLGRVIDYKKAKQDLFTNLKRFTNDPITIQTNEDLPTIYKKDVLNVDQKAKKILAKSPVKLAYKNDIWNIYNRTLVEWLELKIDEAKEDDKVIVGLDFTRVQDFLDEMIAPAIDREPVNAKFEIKDGKVVEFQISEDGQELLSYESAKQIERELLEDEPETISLVVQERKSELQNEEIANLGIKEIIGTGHSSFAGSPANRRHNIAVGAAALNGILIKPDENFSLISALGEIDKESGYLPELVIKDNKTIPEYGGGLCQIGTTLFRTTLQSGLPVTMRRNHSYRVSYYEPAGTDATIYNPWPDYRFLNDTGKHILIQSRIEGDDIYFDFWGTDDGRKIEVGEPTIYNIVSPPPTKYVETPDLPVGQKKCTEHAHAGADASFDYSVSYPNGEIKEETFNSHYIPWREVCLIGVEKLSTDEEEKTATSTPAAE